MAGIQADDLTGACDTGAPFAGRGLETVVLVTRHDGSLPDDGPAASVVVIDTESRGLPGAEAWMRAHDAAARLARARPPILYKKVDSTLRGPLVAELLGAMDGASLATTLLGPAFPAQRRTVVDGNLRVDGRPALETAVARDPAFPRTGASVLALAAGGGACPVSALPLVTVRAGAEAVAARLERFRATGGRTLVADGETGRDLRALAAGAEGQPVLLAGSAGLATALAERLTADRPPAPGHAAVRRPLLVVAGSAHPATRAQIERLGHRDGLHVIAPSAAAGADDSARRRETAAGLATAARAWIEAEAPRGLLLTGGETAIAVLEALAARGLRLCGELEPGLAVATLVGGPFDGLRVVTKAGGFGDADALVRVWERAA